MREARKLNWINGLTIWVNEEEEEEKEEEFIYHK